MRMISSVTMGRPFHEYSPLAVKKHLYLSLASTKRLQCSSCLDILETLWGRPRNTKGIDLVLLDGPPAFIADTEE